MSYKVGLFVIIFVVYFLIFSIFVLFLPLSIVFSLSTVYLEFYSGFLTKKRFLIISMVCS